MHCRRLDQRCAWRCLITHIKGGKRSVFMQSESRLIRESLSSQVVRRDCPSYVEAWNHLIDGISTLRGQGKRFAQPIQEGVESLQRDIAPPYAIECLSLPIDDEHNHRRAQGFEALKDVLWERDGYGLLSPRLTDRRRFIDEVKKHLTAQEHVSLFAEAPSYVPVESWDIHEAALAHVAWGFIARNPNLIVDADNMLDLVDKNSLEPFEDNQHGQEVSIERAMCALLLGRANLCRQRLGGEEAQWFQRDHTQASSFQDHLRPQKTRLFVEDMPIVTLGWLLIVRRTAKKAKSFPLKISKQCAKNG